MRVSIKCEGRATLADYNTEISLMYAQTFEKYILCPYLPSDASP